ncbi:MarR family winged helix-turn-helix transcriptional regulator [Parafrigoribacterium humi]|uniref:MarR family winged helix-turn-helix transcriptional regulator n=1 Tax=Parafrigoribacterium humi TaxID=3144664 RepID=UPI0032EF2CCD
MARSLRDTGLSVKRVQMRHHHAMTAALAPLEISLVQWDALRHLHENPDASLHDLAQLTFQSDQGFGTLAGRMIARGLIERVPGPGRAVRHRLTAKGEDLRERGANIADQVLTKSFQSLTPAERETLDELLQRLLDNPLDNPL